MKPTETSLPLICGVILTSAIATAKVESIQFQAPAQKLKLEFLTDTLVHFEFGNGATPSSANDRIAVSPMIQKTDYEGPTQLTISGKNHEEISTPSTQIIVNPVSLCFSLADQTSSSRLTTVCPMGSENGFRGLSLSKEKMRNLYGLGEEFRNPGNADGDWMGQTRHPGDRFGNQMVDFNKGANGNAQFPILFALGESLDGYALFVDTTRKISWDFSRPLWQIQYRDDALRGYLITGQSLATQRRAYMDLVGHPLVPPKKAFGLWLSQYGYRSWSEIDSKLATLREHHFPIDGFMIDLFWFGGVRAGSDESRMGTLAWDRSRFPLPEEKLQSLSQDQGIGIMAIEESYVSGALTEHQDLASKGYLVKDPKGLPIYLAKKPWWGKGGMIDWTNKEAGDYWHELKRRPLIEGGLFGHWTDLGEPEMYDPGSRYAEGDESEAQNIYNFRWAESIFRGYQRDFPQKRDFILSRSGTSGIQRFGAAMWSGDIASDLSSLASHQNAQLHMSLSGMDYFGSDVGGFHREGLKGDKNEMYTQWLSYSSLFDVPVRPHTNNLSQSEETSPALIGDVRSNLANIQQRYSLIPYLYSLAHIAYLEGDPIFPPPLYYFQSDLNLRARGSEKMIGPWLLADTTVGYGKTTSDVYLPKGEWLNLRDGRWFKSQGETFARVPLYYQGAFSLPLFARRGAIIPRMGVDERLQNALGRESDGQTADDLYVQIVPGSLRTEFPLFEDDGQSTAYTKGEARETLISQEDGEASLSVTLSAAHGQYKGAPQSRNNFLEIELKSTPVSLVKLGESTLQKFDKEGDWETAKSGWYSNGNSKLLIKTGVVRVDANKELKITFDSRP